MVSLTPSHTVRTLVLLALATAAAGASPTRAQQPGALPAVQPGDYGKWEQLSFRTPLSPDGAWLAAPITRVDGTGELRVHATRGTGDPIVVDEGTSPSFSDDSRWLACRVGVSEQERTRLQEAREPVRNGMCLVDLAATSAETLEQVESFAFGGGGAFVAMRRYPATEEATGADLVVRDLNTGQSINFGNVVEYAWQDDAARLAMTIAATDRAGNGVHLYDAGSGLLRVLDSGDADFRGLSWREDAADLVFLRTVQDEAWEETTHQVVAWRNLEGAGDEQRFDPASAAGFPATMWISEHRTPEWSDDGLTLFLGIRERHPAPPSQDDPAADDEDAAPPDTAPADKPADVQVWHSQDERIIPMQTVSRQRDAAATYLAAWHLGSGSFVRLGTDLLERVQLLAGQRLAVETDRKPYLPTNMFDRDWQDVWLVDVTSGDRQKVIENVGYWYGPSPEGRYLLYFQDEQFHAYDVEEGVSRVLTEDLPTGFVDQDYDTPVFRERPPWGVGGWLAGDQAVLLYDRYDVWAVRPSGVGALRLTEGNEEEVEHRVVQPDPEAEAIDPAAIWMRVYGKWTKKQGFARTSVGTDRADAPPVAAGVERLLWLDKSIGFGLSRADQADVYAWVVQGYDDSPDVFVAVADLADPRQITHTNPFQDQYAWGHSELVDYESAWGQRLQGALFYPANYDPSRKYPMIVYVYEQLSETVHSYTAPSERSPYDTTVFNAEGYFVLRPDIVFRNRYPGTSAVECVVPAVQAVLATGMVDPDRVGLVGHSWGGYESAYIPTQTDVFATSVAGAALTNFFSMFGTIHWNQGMPESDHFETGQARMEVPYWDDMEAYVRESPVMAIQNLHSPMLLFHGDADGTVDWHQGVEMYNYARRAGKFLVMLVYPGENHSARRKENQIDYHHRVLQWFGHFLKGEEAPSWITEGVPVLERERELRQLESQR